MGKPTGFSDFCLNFPLDRAALERSGTGNEFHCTWMRRKRPYAGRALHGCGVPFLPHRTLISRHGIAARSISDSRMIIWFTAGSGCDALATSALDDEFSRIHGPVCPAPCEGSVLAGPQLRPPLNISRTWSFLPHAQDGTRLGDGGTAAGPRRP